MRLANDENTAYGLSVLVGLLLAILTIYLWFQVTRNEEAYIQEALNRQAADLSHVIEIELAKDIRGLRRMASRWEVRSDMPLSEWQADAQNYLQDSLIFCRNSARHCLQTEIYQPTYLYGIYSYIPFDH